MLYARIGPKSLIEKLNEVANLIIKQLFEMGIISNVKELPHISYNERTDKYEVD